MGLRRHCAALAMTCGLLPALPAAAQTVGAALVGPVDRPEMNRRVLPEFRPPAGDLRRVGEPRRNGLIAAFPVDDNLQIGLGRFSVSEIARPRTNVEADRQPTAVRGRERGIAAVGFSLTF